jgi:hypothetical protein
MSDFNNKKRNPEKAAMGRKREKIRRTLRNKGILPPVGTTDITPEQQTILNQISKNDFSYWDSIKDKRFSFPSKRKNVFVPPPTKEEIILYRAKQNAKNRVRL